MRLIEFDVSWDSRPSPAPLNRALTSICYCQTRKKLSFNAVLSNQANSNGLPQSGLVQVLYIT